MTVRHLNPDELLRNPAFSQAVVAERPTKTIYVGGQNGVDAEGNVVADDLAGQSRQALQNLGTILQGEGASLADVVRWTIAVVEGHSVQDGYEAFQELWDPATPPPAVTVLIVSGLANPQFLVEIDAIAVT